MNKNEYIEKLVFREIKNFNVQLMTKALNERQISTDVIDGLHICDMESYRNLVIGSLMYNPSTDKLYKLTIDYNITVNDSWILPQTMPEGLLMFVEYRQTLRHKRTFIEGLVSSILNEDMSLVKKIDALTQLESGGLIIVTRSDQVDTRNRPSYTSVTCTFY